MTKPAIRPHRLFPALFTLALSAGALTGCDKGEADSGDAAKAAAEGDKADEGKADEAPTEAEVEKEVKTFLKDQRKKGCEMLPPAMAAKALGLPEADLKQMKMMGCIYTWKSEDDKESAQAQIMSIWVKKDAEKAKRWFENSTKNQTAEELAKQMEMVTARAKKRKEVDTKVKKKTVDTIGEAGVAMMGDGVQYEDVPGVGDAARMNKRDGAVTVLVGNIIFNVQAFKGTAEPPLDIEGINLRDTKAMIAAAKENQDKWLEQTLDVRKQMSIELAKMVVAAL